MMNAYRMRHTSSHDAFFIYKTRFKNLRVKGLQYKKSFSDISHLVSQWKSCLSTRIRMFMEFIPLILSYDSCTRQGACKPALACTHLTCTLA